VHLRPFRQRVHDLVRETDSQRDFDFVPKVFAKARKTSRDVLQLSFFSSNLSLGGARCLPQRGIIVVSKNIGTMSCISLAGGSLVEKLHDRIFINVGTYPPRFRVKMVPGHEATQCRCLCHASFSRRNCKARQMSRRVPRFLGQDQSRSFSSSAAGISSSS
jgi:hypothetical protein